MDAQLPRRIVYRMRETGHDALHTLDLPHGNRTPDAEIIAIASRDDRIVATKDADFVNSFVLLRQPPRLLLISTGNIKNADLETLLLSQMANIEAAFTTCDFVELTRQALVLRA
ncbi:MAG TPA: DUF5615 family PIN-like protein [Ktedonobacterales bacterium]|nr:DUF5615 family PIN-like protein [Ktedonobacterales bacterium]